MREFEGKVLRSVLCEIEASPRPEFCNLTAQIKHLPV